MAFWCASLLWPFCGSILQAPPPAVATEVWVDVSSGWGVGVVFDGDWEAWHFQPGWHADSWKIGWAEMLAIKLGLRLAIQRGAHDTHFVVS
jgi:hypothetical protein